MVVRSVCLSHPKVALADMSFCWLFSRLTLAVQGPFQFDIIGFKTVPCMSQAGLNLSDLSASTFWVLGLPGCITLTSLCLLGWSPWLIHNRQALHWATSQPHLLLMNVLFLSSGTPFLKYISWQFVGLLDRGRHWQWLWVLRTRSVVIINYRASRVVYL